MKKLLLWFALVLCLASAAHSYPVEFNAVCQVETTVSGSGTLIATNDTKGLILTCRHVAREQGAPAEFRWLVAGGQVTYGRILTVVPNSTNVQWETDLALAVCKKPKGVKPVHFAQFDPSEGPWFGAGYPGGFVITISRHCEYEHGVLIFDQPFIPGQSGGPVFNRKGELVAVVVAYSPVEHIGLACDGQYLQKLLAKYGL